MPLKVAFGTIFLNESHFLPLSLTQHYALCDKWFFVEGADVRFPKNSVTVQGLSCDKSAEIVLDYPDPDNKIKLIRHGWAKDKTDLRNRYAELVDVSGCDILIVVDVDEFLTVNSMRLLREALERLPGPGTVRIPHVHFWHDQQHVITGKYWDVPHDRAYRWAGGCRYIRNHNHPERNGRLLRDANTVVTTNKRQFLSDGSMTQAEPVWLHYANCKPANEILDKNKFYLARGEGQTRPDTVKSRDAFFNEVLPEGLVSYKWSGPVPEVMR